MTEPAPYRQFRHVIGIDPGPTPGFVMLTPRTPRTVLVDVVQCTAEIAPLMLWTLLDQRRDSLGSAPAIVAIERFVVGRGSGKSGPAGETTRDLVGKLQREAGDHRNVTVVLENASRVKTWATDRRLQAVHFSGTDLLDVTKGMRHARDAARHALFAAVLHDVIPDPLSKAARSG